MLVGVSALITPGTPAAGFPPCSSRTFSRLFAAANLVPGLQAEYPDIHRVEPSARALAEDMAV
jgi:hypothetical protein